MAWPTGYITGGGPEFTGQLVVAQANDDSVVEIPVELTLLEQAFEAGIQNMLDTYDFTMSLIVYKGYVYACLPDPNMDTSAFDAWAAHLLAAINFYLVG